MILSPTPRRLTFDYDPSRQVGQLGRGIRLVDLLAAWPRAFEVDVVDFGVGEGWTGGKLFGFAFFFRCQFGLFVGGFAGSAGEVVVGLGGAQRLGVGLGVWLFVVRVQVCGCGLGCRRGCG